MMTQGEGERGGVRTDDYLTAPVNLKFLNLSGGV